MAFLSEINQHYLPSLDIFNSTQMNQLNLTYKKYAINLIYNEALREVLSQNFTDDQRKKLSPPIKEILYQCFFNNNYCDSSFFIWKFDRYFGNCFVFNSGLNQTGANVDLLQSAFNGKPTFGFQITFYAGFNDQLSLFNSPNGKGGFVKIENASFLLDETTNGIYINTGNMSDFKYVLRTVILLYYF